MESYIRTIIMEFNNKGNRKIPLLGNDANALIFLIASIAIVFIIMIFTKLTYTLAYDNQQGDYFFGKQIVYWFVLSPGIKENMIKPWSFITYMFTHLSVMGVISTALWLWAFGYILQDLAGNKKIIPVFLYGGWAGAICFMLIAKFNQEASSSLFLMGGGPAVMAIAIATTTLAPTYKIYPLLGGGIPLWILTAFYAAINLTSVSSSYIFLFANLSGGLMGFIFIWQLRMGNDWGLWMYRLIEFIHHLFSPDKKARSRKYMKVIKTVNELDANQSKLDVILDKINEQGIDKLTKEERAFLDNSAKQ